jgi:TPP-dependent pyruvate/acetoin dehydrogenase alpha subunit
MRENKISLEDSAMKFELKMPDLSTTGSPIKVLRWLVAVGELVSRGQPILDVETDKATMEVEALNAGTLLKQVVAAGQEASAGEVLAIIGIEEAVRSSAGRSQSRQVEGLKKYDRDFLLSLYRRMLLIRQFEERVKSLFLEGMMPGTIHQCQGQEATAVGVCAALKASDFITSTFRGHGHALAKGLTVQEMLDELFGAITGCCKGKGGSMHMGNFEKGMIPGIAIVAGGIPVATGMALAFKMQKSQQVVACFFGDGSVAEGAFHEAVNMAALWSAPVLFVCENNLYGASTRIDLVMKNTTVADRAASYGFRGETVDGNDPLAVYEAATKAVEECRSGCGPVLLELLTYRRTGHSRRDACQYQPKEERSAWFAKDPILRFAQALLTFNDLDQIDLEKIREEVDHEIESAVEQAKVAPRPPVDELLTDVYA